MISFIPFDAKKSIKQNSRSEKESNFLIKLYDEGRLGNICQWRDDWSETNLIKVTNLLNSDEFKFDGDAQNYLMNFIDHVNWVIKRREWARDNNIMF